MALDWSTLVAPLTDIDTSRLLGFWTWLVDQPVRPLALTRFGDWFLEDLSGVVFRLDILEGTFAPVCQNAAEYERRKSGEAERDDWFSEGMVESLRRNGLRPGSDEGFGYRIPPLLGGSLERENIVLVNLASWQLFMSGLHRAVLELPPGARVQRIDVLPDGSINLIHS